MEIERQRREEGGGWKGEGEGGREDGDGRRGRGERKREEEGGDEGERREEGGLMGRKEQEDESVNVRGSPRRGRHSSRKRWAGAGVPSTWLKISGRSPGRAGGPDGRDIQTGFLRKLRGSVKREHDS